MTFAASNRIGISRQRGYWLRCFLGISILYVIGWDTPRYAYSQTVCVGTEQECRAAQKKLCEDEPAPANLFVGKAVNVRGVLIDETGSVFVLEDTLVQLREPKTMQVLRETQAKMDGKFDLGIVVEGSYRLVVMHKAKTGALERLPLADQPKSMSCADDQECSLKAVQHIHGTDNPIDFCPPK